mmetsp:Transcript_24735/g.41828  ORF Transcript_24735/g.41828 Transcript_24735/m.41828 type:complete len:158 (-) Transcript_24735:180-653(-)|eukprot:CAMPEP_0114429262 /NCGR_PEP_ID=MMETSP0103-20121206/9384_1 /TAXON_ID=37642 ORGANISM="Paraphysomonas imperforata, Strain PA2" /NCGR_SAMPLE_ID=MMETSP0103 /ASSEMBLY_ACC=CAM_ASM_000201 /LENGTH=157 /DNA_ID=CAMNT_0001598571 /DNA_START=84 /DNA_END=557 /DNA_ORIENTATION=+
MEFTSDTEPNANTNDFVQITENIDVMRTIDLVKDDTAGAISTFMGTTRNNFEGKKVVSLEYEAYIEMALLELNKLCTKIRSQWDVCKIAVVHIIGNCPIGELSVLIAISSAHRKESLEAVDYAINELKKTVPIWKKEIYEEGEGATWKKNAEAVIRN